jgi:predicted transcriptional regulator
LDEIPYSLLGYVQASEYRKRVLFSLKDGLLRPKDIADETKYPQSHVSNTLSELVKQNLVVCTNPESRKGRLYKLTTEGQIIIKHIESMCK